VKGKPVTGGEGTAVTVPGADRVINRKRPEGGVGINAREDHRQGRNNGRGSREKQPS